MNDTTLTASRMKEESIFERNVRIIRLAKNKNALLNNTMIIIHGFSVVARRHIIKEYKMVISGPFFLAGNMILRRRTKIHNSTEKIIDSVR